MRNDCLVDDPALAAWRCVFDRVFTLVDHANVKFAPQLIYVGDAFAGEECIDAAPIDCAHYQGTFTEVYDRLENNALAPRAESPAVLIEMTIDVGVFQVGLEETWKASQERFLAGTKCLNAKSEIQAAHCIDGITLRRASLFNTTLTTCTGQPQYLARTGHLCARCTVRARASHGCRVQRRLARLGAVAGERKAG